MRWRNVCIKTWQDSSLVQTGVDGKSVLYGKANTGFSRSIRSVFEPEVLVTSSTFHTLDQELPVEIYYNKTKILINKKIFEFSPVSQVLNTDNHFNYLILNPQPESVAKNLIEITNFHTNADVDNVGQSIGNGNSNRRTSRSFTTTYNHASMALKVVDENDVNALPDEIKFSVFIFDEFSEMKPMMVNFVLKPIRSPSAA